MNNIKIEELMKVRFDGIASRIGQLSKRESESLLLEHLEWLEGGWETEEILFLKKMIELYLLLKKTLYLLLKIFLD